jgi:hypothetical protein
MGKDHLSLQHRLCRYTHLNLLPSFGLLYTDSAFQSIDFPGSEKASRFLSGTGSAQADGLSSLPLSKQSIVP